MKTVDQLRMLLVFWDVFILIGTSLLIFIGYLNFQAIQEILEMLCQRR